MHSSIVTKPLFYTTDTWSVTEVETALLKSGIISIDIVTSMSASLFAENSSVPTDLINSKTAVTVIYTAVGSLKGVSTPDVILTTEYGATISNTFSFNSVISLTLL